MPSIQGANSIHRPHAPILHAAQLALALLLAASPALAQVLETDFDDQSASPLIHADPFTRAFVDLGGGNFALNVQAPPGWTALTWDPTTTYGDMTVALDLVDWANVDQAVGVSTFFVDGLGADGYVLAYLVATNSLRIEKFTDSVPISSSTAPVSIQLDPDISDYRLVFQRVGASMRGYVVDVLDPLAILGEVTFVDGEYTSGSLGIAMGTNRNPATSIDVTLDHFFGVGDWQNAPTTDSDGDGILDTNEIANGTDPLDAGDPSGIQALADGVDPVWLARHVAALSYERETEATWEAAATYIHAELASYGYTPEYEAVTAPGGESTDNVIAEITGSKRPNDVFILGAHFDTFIGSGTPGANDNASGVATMLELARVMSGIPMAATVRFIGFAREEDLYNSIEVPGSKVNALATAAAGENVIGMISFDTIAYTDPSASTMDVQDVPCAAFPTCPSLFPGAILLVDAEPTGVAAVDRIISIVNEASNGLRDDFIVARDAYVPTLESLTLSVLGDGTLIPELRRSDHIHYWDEGFRAMMISSGAAPTFPFYHEPTDTPDKLDYAFHAEVTRAAATMVGMTALDNAPVSASGTRGRVLLLLMMVGTASLVFMRRPSERTP